MYKSPANNNELDHLISLLSKIPGLGPRSARRAALQLIKKKDSLMRPLSNALAVRSLVGLSEVRVVVGFGVWI